MIVTDYALGYVKHLNSKKLSFLSFTIYQNKTMKVSKEVAEKDLSLLANVAKRQRKDLEKHIEPFFDLASKPKVFVRTVVFYMLDRSATWDISLQN